jgi:antitoxin (DNA-binding transcriptional repressor) of toxin-antitoxin stability system
MKTVNISEAKANFSKLIALVYRGEKVVIAKNNLPLVDLVIHKPEGKRKLGLLAGKFTVPDNITEEDADINEYYHYADWPDFFEESLEIGGKPPSQIVIEERKDRF